MTDSDVALVTGASGLLGAAICRALAATGLTVLPVCHRGLDRAAELAEEIGALEPVRADLTDPAAAMDRIRERGVSPGVLVCAHGRTLRRSVLTPGDDDGLWDVNVHSVTRLAGSVGKGMLRRRGGRIVLVGSRAGSVGLPGQAEYAATKAALSAWAASAAWDFGRFGVTVNVVAPGAVLPGPGSGSGAAVYTEEENRAVADRIALRRLAAPEEIAGAVAFLAGPQSGYITGQTLLVDGGARW
ncbi:SDR family NAD(P)-dependent oxidoreductase [Streptomyces sp. NRRL S-350]|uniref:SDR family NAD(P)-dependent oxidoreductase n=1 Tax=Streptomyces sp. NRRL S-350 TaxID=1463902 RepID=UPI0004BED2C9|nr:SDR family oxidoreductase [Streptomyces sp. NRRL S-350]